MDYFTPDLLARFGSQDDAVADAASAEWEQAHAAYVEHLEAIRSQLPRRVRHLIDRYTLHDARVSTLAVDRELLAVTLQFNDRGSGGLQLNYRLATEPKLVRHGTLDATDPTPLEWLYDEFDLVKKDPFVLFKHNILLTRGLELELLFHGLGLKQYTKVLYPAYPQVSDGARGGLELLAM